VSEQDLLLHLCAMPVVFAAVSLLIVHFCHPKREKH
jgi:hypothetical protein